MQASQRFDSDTIASAPTREQAWLSSPTWDITWIIGPAVLSASIMLLFRQQLEQDQNTPLWVWVCFILLIDVAHVYGTLFRTYLNPQAFKKNKSILLAIPAIAWIGGSLLYSIDGLLFWRVLAYIAVFHFIRQQFGFMVIYSRKEPPAQKRFRWLDCAAIYMATIYPMLFWHTHLRKFTWFVEGDFFSSLPQIISQVGFAVYVLVGAAYLAKEITMALQGYINVPKNLVVFSTALSWWVAIVGVNSDISFTIVNVVSHGIPYMALIWLYHGGSRAKSGDAAPPAGDSPSSSRWTQVIVSNVILFFAFLAFLAYLEEGFWDGLVWQEHQGVFAFFAGLPQITDPAFLALVVPFLALPQSTHYLLDGFIWRVKERNNIWSA